MDVRDGVMSDGGGRTRGVVGVGGVSDGHAGGRGGRALGGGLSFGQERELSSTSLVRFLLLSVCLPCSLLLVVWLLVWLMRMVMVRSIGVSETVDKKAFLGGFGGRGLVEMGGGGGAAGDCGCGRAGGWCSS